MLTWIRERIPAFIGTVFSKRYGTAIAQRSEAAAHQKAQGDAYLREGKLAEATQCYRTSVSIDPTDVKAYVGLGFVLHELSQYQEAERALERALVIDPGNADAHYLLGKIAQINTKIEEALQHFNATLQYDPKFEFAYRDLAGLLLQIGQIEKAEQIAKKGIEIFPQSADFHFLLGNLYTEGRQFDLAIGCFQKTLTFVPNSAEVHKMLGDALRELGQTDAAVTSYRNALQIQPDLVEAQHNLATALQSLGRLEEAVACFRLALQLQPERAELHNNLGNALSDLNQLDAALASYRRALQIVPDFAEGYCNLGQALRRLKQFDAAAQSFRSAIQIKPTLAEAHANLGNLLKENARCDEAVAHLRNALKLKPNDATLHNDLGNTFFELNQFDNAIAQYRQAIQIDPDYADAIYNQGIVLAHIGRLEEAVLCYRKATQINPDLAGAHSNLGNTLKDLGRFDEALAAYRQALRAKPDFFAAHSNLLYTCNFLPDQPAAMSLQEAIRFGDTVAAHARAYAAWPNSAEPGRRLRIGLVSGDFRNHPVGYFIEGILTALASDAASQLELIAYPTFSLPDAMMERIKASCHAWHSAIGLSDENLAQLIRDDGIDILIDLSGHSAHNRLPMFAWKPAPVQVSWLGYFATTGVAAIDYLIADPWTLPATEEVHFTEKIWRLPNTRLCFTAPDIDVNVSSLPAAQNGHITFGCFNNLSKMNARVVAIWASILTALPTSRLFLKCGQLNQIAGHEAVIEQFAVYGIGKDRLLLEGFALRADYFSAYHRVDIALDPFPFTGGTTTVDALWMGVPVLTLSGESFIARQGVGLLMNAGLPDWIAADVDDYVTRAVRHAGDLQALATLRSGLRQQVLQSPVFDARRFAGYFEAALRAMWTRWCDKQRVQAST